MRECGRSWNAAGREQASDVNKARYISRRVFMFVEDWVYGDIRGDSKELYDLHHQTNIKLFLMTQFHVIGK